MLSPTSVISLLLTEMKWDIKWSTQLRLLMGGSLAKIMRYVSVLLTLSRMAKLTIYYYTEPASLSILIFLQYKMPH